MLAREGLSLPCACGATRRCTCGQRRSTRLTPTRDEVAAPSPTSLSRLESEAEAEHELMAMGFSRRRVHYAFRHAGSRIGRALSWLLDADDGMHADDDAELTAAGHSLRKHARVRARDALPHTLASSEPVVHGSSATSDEEHAAAVFCVTPPASPSGIVSRGLNCFARESATA